MRFINFGFEDLFKKNIQTRMFGNVIQYFADNCLIINEERKLTTKNKENADEHDKRRMTRVGSFMSVTNESRTNQYEFCEHGIKIFFETTKKSLI